MSEVIKNDSLKAFATYGSIGMDFGIFLQVLLLCSLVILIFGLFVTIKLIKKKLNMGDFLLKLILTLVIFVSINLFIAFSSFGNTKFKTNPEHYYGFGEQVVHYFYVLIYHLKSILFNPYTLIITTGFIIYSFQKLEKDISIKSTRG